MSNRLTIIFAPVGIRNGLAAAKRIGNLVAYLQQEHQVINLYRDKRTTTETNGNVTFMTAGKFFGSTDIGSSSIRVSLLKNPRSISYK